MPKEILKILCVLVSRLAGVMKSLRKASYTLLLLEDLGAHLVCGDFPSFLFSRCYLCNLSIWQGSGNLVPCNIELSLHTDHGEARIQSKLTRV